MKRLTIITLTIGLALGAQAQDYQKEHTFNKDVRYHSVGDNQSFFSHSKGKTVTLYESNYSRYKEISTPDFNHYKANYIRYLSKSLFNKDEDLEFLVYYTDTTNQGVNQYILMDENGKKLKQFEGFTAFVNKINGEYKLIMRKLSGETTIYSLPGSLSTNAPVRRKVKTNVYPNPANAATTLRYDLPSGQNGQVVVYNGNGQQVDRLRIGPAFDKVRLDVSGYEPGTYFYKVKSGNQQVDKGRLVVQ